MSPEEIEAAWRRRREHRVMDELDAKRWLGSWGSRLVAFREAGLVPARPVRRSGGFETFLFIQRDLREHVANWVTEDEAQRFTGRKGRTLRRWRSEGLVESRPLGRSWVYCQKSLKVAHEAMVQNVADSRKYCP